MSIEAKMPIIDLATGANTCIQITTTGTTAATQLTGMKNLIKCLTAPCYIRFGKNDIEVTAANGYYMAVGDELQVQLSRDASYIAALRVGESNGALSIMPLNAD